jgi:hypothetical protein
MKKGKVKRNASENNNTPNARKKSRFTLGGKIKENALRSNVDNIDEDFVIKAVVDDLLDDKIQETITLEEKMNEDEREMNELFDLTYDKLISSDNEEENDDDDDDDDNEEEQEEE